MALHESEDMKQGLLNYGLVMKRLVMQELIIYVLIFIKYLVHYFPPNFMFGLRL